MEYSPKEIGNKLFQNEITNLVYTRNIKEGYEFIHNQISKPKKCIFMIKIQGPLLWFQFILFFNLVELFAYIIFFLYGKFGIIGIIDYKNKQMIFTNKNKNKLYHHKNKALNSWNLYMGKYWKNIAPKSSDVSSLLLKNVIYKKELLQWWYKAMKKPLNLNNPITFNEKIQWLKLYDSTPIKTILSDKYLVRNWVKEKIGEQYLIPLLGVYENFEDINFNKLPNQFVIKCNHGSGYNILVKDKNKLNVGIIRAKIKKWMKQNYSNLGKELNYRDIQPKIIIEKYMDDNSGDLRDYKINCFNGKPEFLWMDADRHSNHKRNLYDLNWKQLPYKLNSHYETFPSPEKPKYLKKLIKLASILSKGFSYVRVDFYIVNEKIYFGEMTFYTEGGIAEITPRNFEKRLSSLIKIPKLGYIIDIGEYCNIEKPTKTKFYLLFPYYIALFPLIIKLFYYLKKVKCLILVVDKDTLLFKKKFLFLCFKSKKYKLQDITNINILLNYKNNDNSMSRISRINEYLKVKLNKKGKDVIIFNEKIDYLLNQNELDIISNKINDLIKYFWKFNQ